MIKKTIFTTLMVATLFVGPSFAQPSAVKGIIENARTDNRTMHHLDILTNRFGGRLVGSDTYENAAEWMMREFKSWVLSTMITKDPYESAMSTIISSASADPDNRSDLVSTCLEKQYVRSF